MVRTAKSAPYLGNVGYTNYATQFDTTVERATRSEASYLWFHALALRMLEYELFKRFEGVISQFLMTTDADEVRPSHSGWAN